MSVIRDRFEAQALERASRNPLVEVRRQFYLPKNTDVFLSGNSLGLASRAAARKLLAAFRHWVDHGVRSHFTGEESFYRYSELLDEFIAKMLGAEPTEVVTMSSLTENLERLFRTFYEPQGEKCKVFMQSLEFPSDRYMMMGALEMAGYPWRDNLIEFKPEDGEFVYTTDRIIAEIRRRADEICLVVLPVVQFISGECIDLKRIAAVCREHDILFGVQLAHGIGNIPMSLHDWGVDFAVWCGYKYLNAGPGCGGGLFVHEKHVEKRELLHPCGWFGNDPDSRFEMVHGFTPREDAHRFEMSNPQIWGLATLLGSSELFERAIEIMGGVEPLLARSAELSGYAMDMLDAIASDRFTIITPRDPKERGAQVSILLTDRNAQKFEERMFAAHRTQVDDRKPRVIRAAFPAINTDEGDVLEFAARFEEEIAA